MIVIIIIRGKHFFSACTTDIFFLYTQNIYMHYVYIFYIDISYKGARLYSMQLVALLYIFHIYILIHKFVLTKYWFPFRLIYDLECIKWVSFLVICTKFSAPFSVIYLCAMNIVSDIFIHAHIEVTIYWSKYYNTRKCHIAISLDFYARTIYTWYRCVTKHKTLTISLVDMNASYHIIWHWNITNQLLFPFYIFELTTNNNICGIAGIWLRTLPLLREFTFA